MSSLTLKVGEEMFEVFGFGAEFTFSANGTERIGNVVTDLNTLYNTMGEASIYSDRFTNSIEEFSNSLMNSGATEFAKGMTELIGVYATGISKAAAWQDQMIDASRYMSDTSTKAQLEYNSAVADMAKKLGTSKEAINQATISYMQMGKATDTALRLADNAGYAAVAWDMAASDVANSFRQIKAAFKIDMENQDNYQKYLDMVNEVGNNTAATSRDVIRFVGDYGGSLATVGKSTIEEVMSMAAAARFANISVDEFGTTVQRLANTYANGKSKYFEELGVQVTDANGELISFAEALHLLGKEWDNLGASQKQNFLSGFGGLHAANLGLYMGSMDEYEKALKMTQGGYDGSAAKEFSRVTDTFNFALSQLKVTLSDFGQGFWSTLLDPLQKLVKVTNKVVEAFSDFMQAHPALMKIIASLIVLQATVLTLGGAIKIASAVFLKFGLNLKNGISYISGMTKTFDGMKIALKGLSPVLKQSILNFTKMGLTMGLLYATWKFDLFGIRTMFEEFSSKMKISMGDVKNLLSADMSVDGLVNGLNKLDNSNSVIDRLAGNLVRLGLVWQGVAEGWNSYELSDEMFAKLQNAGILPLVTNILLFKMRMDYFFQGVKDGFLETRDAINEWVYTHFGPALNWLKDNVIMPLIDKFPALTDGITAFFDIINGANGDEANERFKTLGKSVGSFIAIALSISSVTKILSFLGKGFSVLGKGINIALVPLRLAKGLFKGIIDLIANSGLVAFAGKVKFAFDAVKGGAATAGEAFEYVFPKIASFGSKLMGVASKFKTFMGTAGQMTQILNADGTVAANVLGGGSGVLGGLAKVGTFLGSGATTAGGAAAVGAGSIAGGVGGAIGLVAGGIALYKGIKNNDDTKKYQGGTKMGMVGAGAAAGAGIGALFGGVGAVPGALIGAGVGGIGALLGGNQIGVGLETFVKEKLPVFAEAIGNFFTQTIPSFFSGLSESVTNFFTVTIPQKFNDFVNFIGGVVDSIGNFFAELPGKIGYALGFALGQFVSFCVNTWNSAVEFFTVTIPSAFNSFLDYVSGTLIPSIGNFFTVSIPNFFNGLYNSVVNFFTVTIPNTFSNFVNFVNTNVIQPVGNFFTVTLPQKFTEFGNTVQTFFTVTIPQKLTDFVNYITNTFIPNVVAGFKELPEKLRQKATEAIEGFVNGVKGAWDKVSGAVSSFCSNFIKGFKDGLDIHSPSKILRKIGNFTMEGFIGGVDDLSSDAYKTATEVSNGVVDAFTQNVDGMNGKAYIDTIMQTPNMSEYTSTLPITTDLNNTNTFYSELSENGVMGTIITQLVLTNQTLLMLNESVKSANATKVELDNSYLSKVNDDVSVAKEVISESNNKQTNITIEQGAIQNTFKIEGTENKEEIADMILSVLDENLLRILMDKISEVKQAMND